METQNRPLSPINQVKRIVSLVINGDPVDAVVNDNMTLLDFLRDKMGLTGTKKGCEQGECGACTAWFCWYRSRDSCCKQGVWRASEITC